MNLEGHSHHSMSHEMEDIGASLGASELDAGHHHFMGQGDMMGMFFHFGLGEQLFMPRLRLDSSLKMVLACACLLLGSLLHEALAHLRGYACLCEVREAIRTRFLGNKEDERARQRSAEGLSNDHMSPKRVDNANFRRCCPLGDRDSVAYGLVQATIQFIRSGLGLLLMLAAMSYNLCLIFAILLGAACGAYYFRPRPTAPGVQHLNSLCH